MNFLYLKAFWLLSSLPMLVLIYALYFRPREKKVSALFLWSERDIQYKGGKRFQLPPITFSMFLELMALLCLIVLLADPMLSSSSKNRQYLFILDNSISMHAQDKQGISALRKAKNWLMTKIHQMQDSDRLTFILAGESAKILGIAFSNKTKAPGFLKEWQPYERKSDFVNAINLVGKMSIESFARILITDKETAEINTDALELHTFGKSMNNIGFTFAKRLVTARDDIIYFELKNYARLPQEFPVKCFFNANMLFSKNVVLQAFEKKIFQWRIKENIPAITLSLPDDPFTFDNKAYFVHPIKHRLMLQTRIKNSGLRKMLYKVLHMFPEVSLTTGALQPPFVLIQDHIVDTKTPGAFATLHLGTLDGKNPEELNYTNGPFIIKKPHFLTEELFLRGAIWCVAQKLPPVPDSLIQSKGYPLLYFSKSNENKQFLHMNILAEHSNLDFLVDWPVFWFNFLQYFKNKLRGHEKYHYNYAENVIFDFTAALPSLPWKLYAVNGRESKFYQLYTELDKLKPGIYNILLENKIYSRFAINPGYFEEGDLTKHKSFDLYSKEELNQRKKSPGGTVSLEAFFLLFLLFLLLTDWIYLRKFAES
ncbi:BatA and WFA domain-containing protein [Candidatus Riflebacteria bacterium]